MSTTLRMSCNLAVRKPSGVVAVSYDLTGKVAPPLPPEEAPIATSAEAAEAFRDYCARVRATGLGAVAVAFLGGEGRAPRGFRKLELRAECNLPELPTA